MTHRQIEAGGFGYQATPSGRDGTTSGEAAHTLYPRHGGTATPDPARRGRFVKMLYAENGRPSAGVWRCAEGLVLRRIVRSGAHLLRSPEPSWCFDVGVALEARRLGCVSVEVVDERDRLWRVDLETLCVRAELIDRGYGEQLRLALRAFAGPDLSADAAAEAGLPAARRRAYPAPVPPAQASLFGEVEP